MIVAYHCIFSAYGFWLPNDQRSARLVVGLDSILGIASLWLSHED